jgi:hypothetical protein
MNRLELELDDWLDPSLPSLYHITPGATRPFLIACDFTPLNEDFAHTALLPRFTPVMRDGVILLVARQ